MIYLLLADGFEEVEALAPLDLLRRANKEILTVSITDKTAVTGAHGITVLADLTADAISLPCDEMLILPGGMPGTKNLDASPVTDRLIGEIISHEGYLAAICAAPSVLGKRGLLVGKSATCYPGFEKELLGAKIENRPVVVDGKTVTANGMPSALLFGEVLVALLKGEAYPAGARVLFGEPGEIQYDKKHFPPDYRIEPTDSPEDDALLWEAIRVSVEAGKVTTSLLQRTISLGFGRAAKLIDRMTELGIVSEPNEQKPRFVFMTVEDYKAIRKDMDEEV